MGAQVNLQREGRVAVVTYSDPWSLDDVNTCDDEVVAHMDSVSHTVHVVMDARGMKQMPKGVLRARASKLFFHPKRGQLVVIGAGVALRAISEVILKLTNQDQALFFDKEADAWAHIENAMATESQHA
jgi:hypothetical protein